ncbi:MAG: molybdopterin-dependent oxidoreductase, partial [Gammaproteobacteria bacterium]|nr:molybdopterin-dependent oxidoreductase [Gemmatimonadota bacterium]NIT68810.1 molybdopterin-dependent oxidoreductase [Gemmatimonadota bacterium]NIV53940.1 molybdopterin-dependent oxidoreductase [Gammaproteobacteria bacterium]NIY37387.1 molybdopterin-dependent oxidoreductase [Gemmatimonadota bacterium]
MDEVIEIESGVAVIANGYVAAKAGRDALQIEWDEGEGGALDDAEIFRRLKAAALSGGRELRNDGDVDATFSTAETLRAEYRLPYLAHATMEPMNCTAWVHDGQCTVWAPTQFQNAP